MRSHTEFWARQLLKLSAFSLGHLTSSPVIRNLDENRLIRAARLSSMAGSAGQHTPIPIPQGANPYFDPNSIPWASVRGQGDNALGNMFHRNSWNDLTRRYGGAQNIPGERYWGSPGRSVGFPTNRPAAF